MQQNQKAERYFRPNGIPEEYPFRKSFIRKAIFTGLLPVSRVGRCVFIKESDLIALLDRGKTQ